MSTYRDTSCANYRLTRRAMMKTTAAAAFLGMPVSRLVSLAATPAAASSATAEHVILFWMGGGMSHLDTWDPKPGRPTQGEFEPIDTSADGIQISEIFPQLAKQMHHSALVRSIAGTTGDHGGATYNLQTGYKRSPNLVHPGVGSIAVHEKEPLSDLPSFVTISGNAPSAGYLGQACEAYYVSRPGEKDPLLAFPAGISQIRGQRRLDVLSRMNMAMSKDMSAPQVQSAEKALGSAVDLMHSPSLEAFDLAKVTPEEIERYGDTDFGRGALIARRLVENGVRFVQVRRGGFDTHSNNFNAMRTHGEVMDPALSSLVGDLAASGKLDRTLVIMLSEFGRTPRVNGRAGRDHHSRCFSCFMAGGGIIGGNVIGASDEDGYVPAERPVSVPDLHATICYALGINHAKEVTTPLGRPMRLVTKGGHPVKELFGQA